MSVTLDALLEKLAASAESKTAKGTAFEQLIAAFLRTAPEFADRFSEVHLWQDWPERGNQHDHGIDIVARDLATEGWCAIQCKFYEPTHHVSKADLDSFLAASSKTGFTSRVIVSTAKDWGKTAEAMMDSLQIPVVRISYADLLASKVEWEKIDPLRPVPDVLPTSERKQLRPHQREAMEHVFDGFTKGDRGQLIMACGTGKTFTSLKIAEQVAAAKRAANANPADAHANILFLVPSIQLANQSLREWKQETGTPFRAFAVCSDIKVGERKVAGNEDLSVRDLIYPATTDAPALVREMQKASHAEAPMTVVFSTYQSIDVIRQAQEAGAPEFDLIICDEAHRTTGVTLAGDDESQFVRVHDANYLKGKKRLYMTATPRLFDPNTKEKAKDANAVLASMDDETKFGPVWHRLGFGEAVQRDLLTDYKVLVLTVDEGYVARNFQQAVAQSGEIQLGDAAKIIGCWNGLAKKFGKLTEEDRATMDFRPMRRAVAFAKDIKTSKATAAAFPDITRRHAEAFLAGDDDVDADGLNGDAHLRVDVRHVDGTMNAQERGNLLSWLEAGAQTDENVCRILSNARCLSEGVDVPSLDAVMFLSPRGSQVDVVQSVGRVMRKADGKDFGYIILPVVIPEGVAPEVALQDNERFKVVWQVLQALRAHDDRFNAMVNKIDLNKKKPANLSIFGVPGRSGDGETQAPRDLQLSFDIEGWRDSIYARIVQKVGERRYWETWAKDVAHIAQQHIARINGLLADPESPAALEFEKFLDGLRGNLNDGITPNDAVEMLAQHLITRPVFDALFGGYDFAAHNPVARTMDKMLAVLDEHSLDTENQSLEKFYAAVRSRVEGIDNAEGRQKIIIELYDKFFATAFKKTVDKLGIVYTPVEIVDFILNSADQVLRAEFGQGLTDEGVHILDGFTGTGTFMVRLLQSGLIQPHDLARKYATELHANEILLLAYYIAAVNIETTYQDIVRGTLDPDAEYTPFPGLVLTDTFQSWEADDRLDLDVFPENNERLEKLKALPITVIIGNPPYSSGQKSANDNNANEKYPNLDTAIRNTYAAMSSTGYKNSLYDSYVRAIKWATLRVKDRGVIAFVTNGGFIDSNTADGMRKTLVDEFSAIHVLNLRGNMRSPNWKAEGGQIFGAGSQATVAITVLVKNPGSATPATISYSDIGSFLTREEKLRAVSDAAGLDGLSTRVRIIPDAHGDWLGQRTNEFASWFPLSPRSLEGDSISCFGANSSGVFTSRDIWAYSYSHGQVLRQMLATIERYNELVERWTTSTRDSDAFFKDADVNDPRRISWDRQNRRNLTLGRQSELRPDAVRVGLHRPFAKEWLYFDREWNNCVYQVPSQFPTASHRNIGFVLTGPASHFEFCVLMADAIPNLHTLDTGQFFSRWKYEPAATDGTLAFDTVGEVVDGYRRIDNITDEALRRFRGAYGEAITKDDIFFYVYGLLHSPDYRETYAADLKKMLPRIPLVEDAQPFIDAGRALADLHLGYESVTPYPLGGLDVAGPGGDADYEFFRVEKMRFGKPTPLQKAAGETKDRSTVVYNNRITLTDVPAGAYRYMLGSRSAVEWVIDRYQVKTDKDSGIVNDPNDWSKEVGDPRYIIDLLARIVTVSLETMQIVDALPPLAIRPDQGG